MKFRGDGRQCGADEFYLNGVQLEIVNEYQYLGVTLQTAFDFNKQVTKIKTKAVVSKLSSHVSKLSFRKALQVFDSQVKSIVTYALHIYAPYLVLHALVKLDRIKSNYLKKILSLPTSTSTERTRCTLYVLRCWQISVVDD